MIPLHYMRLCGNGVGSSVNLRSVAAMSVAVGGDRWRPVAVIGYRPTIAAAADSGGGI